MRYLKTFFRAGWLLLFGFGLLLAKPAQAQIIIDPPPCDLNDPLRCPPVQLMPLQLQQYQITVDIVDQVATTRIRQVFYNPGTVTAEGTYTFPLASGASIGGLTLTVDGRSFDGKVLDAGEAKQIYTRIVQQRRDPALLEYVGRGAIQASLFPVPPNDTRTIEITYSEVLTAENGLVQYRFPLKASSPYPIEQLSLHVAIQSKIMLKTVYVAAHAVAIDRPDNFHASVGYEASQVRPDQDFQLFYSLSQSEIGANLLSYFDPIEQMGYFLLLAAPDVKIEQPALAKDVVIVLDTSGSMEGEKLAQAKSAVRYVLAHLNATDRFQIVEFSTGVRLYHNRLQPVDAVSDAKQWVNNLSATGGTDINRALLEGLALNEKERPTMMLFLTDGLPTEGVTDLPGILQNFTQAAQANVRLFAFGVGDDVDTYLLDSLSQAQHGATTYVRPGQSLDETVSSFYAKISSPVLANPTLDFGTITVQNLYPDPLPDLFAGAQLVAVGQYRQGGGTTLSIQGQIGQQSKTFTYPEQQLANAQTSQTGLSFLPRLWATRRIGYLLNQMRLHGENRELVDEVVRLSVKYGILTPYTSFLITEDDILSENGRAAAAEQSLLDLQAAQAASQSGSVAVDRADQLNQLDRAENLAAHEPYAPTAQAGLTLNPIQAIGANTFLKQNEVWTQTTFDHTQHTAQMVAFGSPEYFTLLEQHPELTAAFALGEHVIAQANNGQYYQVQSASTTDTPSQTPAPDATNPPAVLATAAFQLTPTAIATAAPIQAPDFILMVVVATLLLCLIGAGVWLLQRKG